VNMMKALKESKKTSKRQPGTGGSSKGTSSIPWVPDESTIVPTTSSEGTESEYSDDDDDDEDDDDDDDDDNDEKSIDLEKTKR
ncbi:hypothetical protein Tco_0501330, partial [Tanacetum coccineum]